MTLWMIAGCAGSGGGPAASGDRQLTATMVAGQLAPGASTVLTFVLTSGGLPLGGQTVTFSFSNPAVARGATLTPTSTVTDSSGAASVTVHAGQDTLFVVIATAGAVSAPTTITVGATIGTVLAQAFFADSTSISHVNEVEVLLFDGGACKDLDPTRPPQPTRSPQSLPAKGGTATFTFVSTSQPNALVGRAVTSNNTTVAAGCVDLAGGSLQPDGTVVVALPLEPTKPDPTGTYAVTSTFTFSPPLAAAAASAAPWLDLADCPLDPAQLWLDCTIDALSPATAADPLDCVPASAPGAEGALGDALAAGRGTFLVDPAQVNVVCRGGKDASQRVSLDAITLGLYGSPLPAQVAALPAIATDASHLLDALKLESTLVVATGSAESTYVVTHTLEAASLGAGTIEVPLGPLALPVLTATAAGTQQSGLLSIARHGFTLRLGTIAAATLSADLADRGFLGAPSDFVTSLAALARSADGSATGCAALDAALCPRVSYPAGCLVGACNAGLAALASRLQHAFDPANGSDIDFTLEGSVPVLPDPRGTGFADYIRLGDNTPGNVRPGTWTAGIRTSLDRTSTTGTFFGTTEN